MDPVWTIDVICSTRFPVNPDGDVWFRYQIAGPDPVAAELAACQMAAHRAGHHPVRSAIIDWTT
jgi:hypothetical protein